MECKRIPRFDIKNRISNSLYRFHVKKASKVTKICEQIDFTHSRPENLKKVQAKKLIFCNYKKDQKSFFELGKCLKPPKMQFHEKKNLLQGFQRL